MASRASFLNVESIIKRIDQCIVEEDYYTVLQLYKTLCSRFLQSGQGERARSALKRGAIMLLDVMDINAGSELAIDFINFLKNHSVAVSSESLGDVLEIFFHYPPDSAHFLKISFIKKSISWSMNPSNSYWGAPELHLEYAKFYERIKDYESAQMHYLRANDPYLFAQMIQKWVEEFKSEERDLFVARAVLQYLSLGNLKDANHLIKILLEPLTENEKNLPMYNFLHFLLLTLERDALPLFKMLEDKYSISISRDPNFKKYLDKIASVFFNVKEKDQLNGFMDIFNSLLGNNTQPPKNNNNNPPKLPLPTLDLD